MPVKNKSHIIQCTYLRSTKGGYKLYRQNFYNMYSCTRSNINYNRENTPFFNCNQNTTCNCQTNENNSNCCRCSCNCSSGTQGPIGPQGPQGEPGPRGLTGVQGPVGPTGMQGPIGPQGPIGATGAQGPQGPQGIQGPAGSDGLDGTAATVTVGTTTTGAAGSEAIVTNVGTDTAAILNFTIPAGATGPQGPQGIQGIAGSDGLDGTAATVTVGTTTTGAPGSEAIVTNVGTDTAAILNFTIPAGESGEITPGSAVALLEDTATTEQIIAKINELITSLTNAGFLA